MTVALPRSALARSAWYTLAAAMVVFHMGLVFWGLVPNLVSRPVHMAFVLPWIFLYGQKSRSAKLAGLVLTVAGCAAALWTAANHDMLSDQYGFLESNFQVAVSITLLVCVIEAARRAVGWPLPLVATIALLYALFGQHIPGEFGHSGTPLRSFLGTFTIAEGGIWGSLTAVSVGVVSIFVIFGAVLNAGEAGQGFMNLAAAAAGRLKGGAAKISVLSSALFGSISGSASANVASTGSITLPAMLRLGYPGRLAAAVEAVASSGGQIMPPLMGAGAFVMAELTGIPYTAIVAAAILPALLYFLAVWIGINAYARRFVLRGIAREDQPGVRDVLVTSAFFVIPFGVLMWGMFVASVTPQYAACLAIVVASFLLIFNRKLKVDRQQIASRIGQALLGSARQIAMIASIILCASIIVGVLSVTGLGIKITSLILSASGGMLWPSLLLAALACLILGMEVPTTAAYVICISVAGPALLVLEIEPLQAHLYVFWFALLSTITPPVCGAVFIAAGMTGENWLKVALTSMSLGIGLYIIPLGMIANPAILELSENPAGAMMAFVRIALGLGLISFGLIAMRHPPMKALMAVTGTAVVFSGIWI